VPCQELLDVLTPALAPCKNFSGVCRGITVWDPPSGHIPRGFGGANGRAHSVKLILVTAEPGPPGDGEIYSGSPSRMLDEHIRFFERVFRDNALRRRGRAAPFHSGLRTILDLCWPEMNREDQLALTWFTNAVKCSAATSGGRIPRNMEEICASSYLKREVEALPNAYVLALGGKASSRLAGSGIRLDGLAQHPSARPNTNPSASWEVAARQFRRWLVTNPS
jgi:hypothetical protein